MYGDRRFDRQPRGFGFGPAGRPPRDLLILLGVLFVTYVLVRLGVSAVLSLYLSPDVFRSGYLWQLVTYAFIGVPQGGTFGLFWFLLSLLILYWFSRDTLRALGRRSFWRLTLGSVVTASVVTVVVDLLLSLVGLSSGFQFYPLVQGQFMMLTIMIAAFAVLYGNATILFMFVVPIRARWFLWIEILLAFIAWVDTSDFAGFCGICAAVGMTYVTLTTGSLRRSLRELRLRIERRVLELKMKRMRSKRRFRVVKNDDDVHRGPWVN